MYRLATKCTTKNEVHALQTWVPTNRYSVSRAASRHSAVRCDRRGVCRVQCTCTEVCGLRICGRRSAV